MNVNEILKLLYPECDIDNLNEEQLKEKKIIEANLERINDEADWVAEDAIDYGVIHLLDDATILRRAIYYIRKEITADKIGAATINIPTIAKKEAERVENGENTRDNIKEGEEVGDDN